MSGAVPEHGTLECNLTNLGIESMDVTNDIGQLKERLNKDINDIEAALSLGNLYYDMNDAPRSIVYYRRVLDINPALTNARTDLGAMYWRNEDIGLAEQAFRDAIAGDSSFGQAYVNLGLLLHHARGKVTEARAVWQQLLAVNPEHSLAAKARELLQETSSSIN
jgi:tetratricopeptide (TPR) repeat protein